MKQPDLAAVRTRLPELEGAQRYFCFARSWWDGAGFGASLWHEANGSARHLLLRTSETHEFKPAKRVKNESLASGDFEDVLSEFADLVGLGHQLEKLILAHYDVWYGLKQRADDEPHWVFVAGGKHSDAAAERLLNAVMQRCPELFEWR